MSSNSAKCTALQLSVYQDRGVWLAGTAFHEARPARASLPKKRKSLVGLWTWHYALTLQRRFIIAAVYVRLCENW